MRTRGAELGNAIVGGHLGEYAWVVETRAGDRRAAEQELRGACRDFEPMGERGRLSTRTAELGHVLCDLGEYDKAETWAAKSRELGRSTTS
jgi:hypothetical protein